jgi:hypothetical protein
MAIDYGGVSSLAQAVLAINMAYVALDRFRYKAEVERRFDNTKRQLPELPETHKTDLAYKYLEGLGPGHKEAWDLICWRISSMLASSIKDGTGSSLISFR